MRAVLPLLLLLALVPTPASAVSVQQIVALSNSGVSDEVILALIERDKTIFTIDPDELVALKRQGVSQTVVLAMLRSGRSQPAAPTEADAVATPSVAVVRSVPDTVIVGHGPDRPNTSHWDGFFSVPGTVTYFVYVPVPQWSACAPRSAIASRPLPSTSTGYFGRFMSDPTARFQTDGSRRFLNNGFVSTAGASAADSVVVDCPQPVSRLREQIR
jgi:hypothetical protein